MEDGFCRLRIVRFSPGVFGTDVRSQRVASLIHNTGRHPTATRCEQGFVRIEGPVARTGDGVSRECVVRRWNALRAATRVR